MTTATASLAPTKGTTTITEPDDVLAATRPKGTGRHATAAQKSRRPGNETPALKRNTPTPEQRHAHDVVAAEAREVSEDMAAETRLTRRPGTSPVGIANTVPAGYPKTPVYPLIENAVTEPAIVDGIAVLPAPADRPGAPDVLTSHYPVTSKRVQQIKALALIKIDNKRIPRDALIEAAAQLGVSPEHCRRMVREFIDAEFIRDPSRHRPKIKIDDEVRLQQAYFLANGDAAEAYKRYLDPAMHLNGASLRTFQRMVREWPAPLREAAKTGVVGMIKQQIFNEEVIPYRGYAYGMDHSLIKVRVLPGRGAEPEFVWLTSCKDLYSGVVLAYRFTIGTPNTETVLDVLVEAVRGRYLPDGTFIGGKPEFLRTDRGADFISRAASMHLLNLDIQRQLSKPYSSWQNGRVERFHRIVDEKFAPSLPGYHAGGADDYSRRTGSLRLPSKAHLTADTVDRRFGDWLDGFHNTPRKSRGGKTPYDLWRESGMEHGIEMARASQDEIVYAMSHRTSSNLHHYGVEVRKRRYQSHGLKALRDASVKQVDLRYHEHDLDSVEVFVEGKWQCTARTAAARTQGEKAALTAMREADNAAAREYLMSAENARALMERRRQIAEGVPEDQLLELPFPDIETEEPEDDLDPFTDRNWAEDFHEVDDPVTGYRVDAGTGEITE